MDERTVEIQRELEEMERTLGVTVLFAVESGSRAWGFASPDSDYDVRFVYIRPIDHYLRIGKRRDTIEWKLDDVLDINGWDLNKALMLLHNANPTLFEWMASDIVYRRHPMADRLLDMAPHFFLPRPGLFHYMNMAQNNYREAVLQGETVRLKKYLYTIRPLLACRHILACGTPPPIRFTDLLAQHMDRDTLPYVEELLRQKMTTPEIGEGPRIDALNAYIERSMEDIRTRMASIPLLPRPDIRVLDEVFCDMLGVPKKTRP